MSFIVNDRYDPETEDGLWIEMALELMLENLGCFTAPEPH